MSAGEVQTLETTEIWSEISVSHFRKSRGIQVPVLSKAEMWKQDKLKKLQKLQNKAREILFFLALWGKTLQKIGGACRLNAGMWSFNVSILNRFLPTGNFGGGVQSYFLFLRFLVILNFVSFLLMAGFVIIPSLVFRQVGVSFMNSNSTGKEGAYDSSHMN